MNWAIYKSSLFSIFYMTLKLQRVGYHGNRLDFVKLKGL